MKKYISLFLLTVLVSSSVIAQSKAKPKQLDPFTVIFRAAINTSIFSNPSATNTAFTHARQIGGFSFGISGNWPLTPVLSFQPGIKITSKGSYADADTAYYHVSAAVKPVYLEVPLNLVAKYQLQHNVYIYVGAGPYVAKGVGGKNNYTGTSGVLGSDAPFSGSDKIIYGNHGTPTYAETFGNMQSFDFGANALVGIQYWKFSLSLDFDMGLTNISYGGLTPNSGSQNRSLSLSLGFHL